LLLAQITVEINFIVEARVIVNHIRYYFTLCAAAQDNFIGSHFAILNFREHHVEAGIAPSHPDLHKLR
jgi:hypothetical protein